MFTIRSLFDHVGNIHWDGRRGLHWVKDDTLATNSILINRYFDQASSDSGEAFIVNVRSYCDHF